MPRQATQYAFCDGVGSNPSFYVGNDSKILHFFNWYKDLCLKRNQVLIVTGQKGSGKSTLISYCHNFIENKANYALLETKKLYDLISGFGKLPKANTFWVANSDIRALNGSYIDILCNTIKRNTIKHKVAKYIGNITSSISQGAGGPETSLSITPQILSRNQTMQDLSGYLLRNSSKLYIVWFQSLPERCCDDLLRIHHELMSVGARNLGIVISVDGEVTIDECETSCDQIHIDPLNIAELSTLLAKVCEANDIRYDIEISEAIIRGGCATYYDAIKLLQTVEKQDQSYISLERIQTIMGGK